METSSRNPLRHSSLLAAVAAVSFLGCATAQKSQDEHSFSPAKPAAAQRSPSEYYRLLETLDSQMEQFKLDIEKASNLLAKIDVDIVSRKIEKLVGDTLELTKANAGSQGGLIADHPDKICPIYDGEDEVEDQFGDAAAALDEAAGDLAILKKMREGAVVVAPPEKAADSETFRATTVAVADFIADGEQAIADLRKELDDKMVDAGVFLLPSRRGELSGLDVWDREACGGE